MDAAHDMVLSVVRVPGSLAASKLGGARILLPRGGGRVCALLAVIGLVPGADTTFGPAPTFGADVPLHGVIMLATASFGWIAREPARVMRASGARRRVT